MSNKQFVDVIVVTTIAFVVLMLKFESFLMLFLKG